MKRLALLLGLLAACPAAKHPTGEAGFRVFYPDAGSKGILATTNKRMQAKPAAACTYPDGREAHWANTGASVEQGALAPGLVIEDGAIAGIPTQSGLFLVTIHFAGVTCAGKPQPDQHVAVSINVR